ncbi:MAG: SRPBCC family protein [Actinomycetota bacterium]
MDHDMSSDLSREMETLEESIEVDAPLRVTYDRWTQFEEFPRFMEGVESVTQIDDSHVHWIASVAGRTKEWDAEITRQVPDEEIAWVGLGDPDNRGRVVFEPVLTDDERPRTRVTMMLDYEPDGVLEQLGDALGLVRRRVQGDMVRFKEFIEERGRETGGWRGAIHAGDETSV